jgi:hypothetical protein
MFFLKLIIKSKVKLDTPCILNKLFLNKLYKWIIQISFFMMKFQKKLEIQMILNKQNIYNM